MRHGLNQYQNPILQAASPRESEAIAFRMSNAALSSAVDAIARIRALHRNHQLWSSVVKNVALESNPLPATLKEQLAGLGAWAMAYSVSAMTKDLSLDPLIAVNRNISDGLHQPATAAELSDPVRRDAN